MKGWGWGEYSIKQQRPSLDLKSVTFHFPPLGAIRVSLCAKEELKEAAAVDPAPSSHPSVPASPQGGHRDCLSPSGLEAVPRSSVKDVLCLDVCDGRSSSAGSAQPSLGTSLCPSVPSASSWLLTRQGRRPRAPSARTCLYTVATLS